MAVALSVLWYLARNEKEEKVNGGLAILPMTLANKEVEIIVREFPETDVVDELYGIASDVEMSEDDIRRERLAKYETVS